MAYHLKNCITHSEKVIGCFGCMKWYHRVGSTVSNAHNFYSTAHCIQNCRTSVRTCVSVRKRYFHKSSSICVSCIAHRKHCLLSGKTNYSHLGVPCLQCELLKSSKHFSDFKNEDDLQAEINRIKEGSEESKQSNVKDAGLQTLVREIKADFEAAERQFKAGRPSDVSQNPSDRQSSESSGSDSDSDSSSESDSSDADTVATDDTPKTVKTSAVPPSDTVGRLPSDPDIEDFTGVTFPEETDVEPAWEPPVALTRGSTGVYDIDDLVLVLKEANAKDVCVMRVPAELCFTDYMVVVSAMSKRHMRAIAADVKWIYKQKKTKRDPALKVEGEGLTSDWVAMDIGNIVLHIFLPAAREKYDLETLWTLGPEFDPHCQQEDDSSYVFSVDELPWLEELEAKTKQKP